MSALAIRCKKLVDLLLLLLLLLTPSCCCCCSPSMDGEEASPMSNRPKRNMVKEEKSVDWWGRKERVGCAGKLGKAEQVISHFWEGSGAFFLHGSSQPIQFHHLHLTGSSFSLSPSIIHQVFFVFHPFSQCKECIYSLKSMHKPWQWRCCTTHIYH